MGNNIRELTNLESVQENDLSIEERATIRKMAFSLLHTWAEEENMLFSPLSMIMGFSMLCSGASGISRELFQNMFRLDPDALRYSLMQTSKALDRGLLKTTMQLCNSLWLEADAEVKKSYLKTLTNYYSARLFTAELAKKKTKDSINKWVRLDSALEINRIFAQPLSEQEKMVLINACSFRCDWKQRFRLHGTVRRPFFTDEDTYTYTDYMADEGNMCFIEDDNCEGFAREFDDDQTLLIAIKPKDRITLSEVIQSVGDEKLNGLLASATIRNIKLLYPKYTVSYQKNIREEMMNIGLESLFRSADFSEMCEQPLNLTGVYEYSRIAISEEGGNDRSLSGILEKIQNEEERESKDMIFDHPFLYFLFDRKLSAFLMFGTITDPSRFEK